MITDLRLITFFTWGLGIGCMVWLFAIGLKFTVQACFGSERSIENPIDWDKQG